MWPRLLALSRVRKGLSSRHCIESCRQDVCCERTAEFQDHQIRSYGLLFRQWISRRLQRTAIPQGPSSTPNAIRLVVSRSRSVSTVLVEVARTVLWYSVVVACEPVLSGAGHFSGCHIFWGVKSSQAAEPRLRIRV